MYIFFVRPRDKEEGKMWGLKGWRRVKIAAEERESERSRGLLETAGKCWSEFRASMWQVRRLRLGTAWQVSWRSGVFPVQIIVILVGIINYYYYYYLHCSYLCLAFIGIAVIVYFPMMILFVYYSHWLLYYLDLLYCLDHLFILHLLLLVPCSSSHFADFFTCYILSSSSFY